MIKVVAKCSDKNGLIDSYFSGGGGDLNCNFPDIRDDFDLLIIPYQIPQEKESFTFFSLKTPRPVGLWRIKHVRGASC